MKLYQLMNIIYTAQWLTGFVRKQIFSSFSILFQLPNIKFVYSLCLPRINNPWGKTMSKQQPHTQHILWLWTNISDFFWWIAHLYRNSTLWLSWLYLKHKSHPLTVPLSKWKKKASLNRRNKRKILEGGQQWRDLTNLF